MATDIDAIEALDEADFSEFEEAFRPAVRTPSSRSSFQPRTPVAAASQGQVQAAARNLDSKIETLSNAVKALESRTNTLTSRVDRTASGLAREVVQRKKAEDAIRADVQQTKSLAVLLPLLSQKTITATDSTGATHNVLTQSDNTFATLLPLFLILPGTSQADGTKGPFGGDMLTTLLLFKVVLDK
jgi:hypothetical protein